MKLYVLFSKKTIAVFAAVFLLVLELSGEFSAARQDRISGKTNALRLEFLSSIGLKTEEECESKKEIKIPEKFGEVYKNYNEIQKKSGFDLYPYSGCRADVYTYKVTDTKNFGENTFVNIIVLKGEIIGGDISSRELSGFMLPLFEK